MSDVTSSTRSLRFGATAKTPSMKLNAWPACSTLAARIGNHAALTGSQHLTMIDASRHISRQDGHSAGFATSAADDGPELLDRLQRLAVATCEGGEDGALVLCQLLADDGDQKDAPGGPG